MLGHRAYFGMLQAIQSTWMSKVVPAAHAGSDKISRYSVQPLLPDMTSG